MRVEPYGIGSIVHVVKRGTRGLDIVRDDQDQLRFARTLFLLNDTHNDDNWQIHTSMLAPFQRPADWPERDPLVRVLAWTLMPNHFHLLLEEIREGGMAKFMQRLCGSMSKYFNAKYSTVGSIFQSSYKGKTVDNDSYLRTVTFYILVKNVLELYPGGISAAMQDFDEAWEWALRYPSSSLFIYALGADSPIIEKETVLTELFADRAKFKDEAREMLKIHMQTRTQEFESLLLEQW
jgi:Transposase IS200 like